MKKIVMILMMMITFVGFAAANKTDSFDYDKYVGYYSIDEPFDPEFSTFPVYEIRKDKKGNYYLIDYTIIRGIAFKYNKIYFDKLKKNNGKFYNDETIYSLIDRKLIINYAEEKGIFRKSHIKEIDKLKSILKESKPKFVKRQIEF